MRPGMSGTSPWAKLTLKHLDEFSENLREAGIKTDVRSPMLLPDYRFENALTKIAHIEAE